jgi:hypothetical protein
MFKWDLAADQPDCVRQRIPAGSLSGHRARLGQRRLLLPFTRRQEQIRLYSVLPRVQIVISALLGV